MRAGRSARARAMRHSFAIHAPFMRRSCDWEFIACRWLVRAISRAQTELQKWHHPQELPHTRRLPDARA